MTRDELKQELEKLGIPERYYSLYGDLREDSLVIYRNYHKWEVFYFERGGRYDEKIFSTEDDACEYVLNHYIDLKKTYLKYDMPL